MSFYTISILISAILGLIIILKIRSYDIYEKEPISNMIVSTVLGGGLAVLISLGLYHIVIVKMGIDTISIRTFIGFLVIVGPIEEFSKFIGFYIVTRLFKQNLNELSDGIIYISCVALGFSLYENIQYANLELGNEYLIFLRAIVSTPIHISCSSIMGFAYYKYFQKGKSFNILTSAFFVSCIAHGLFDWSLKFLTTLIMIYFVVTRMLGYTLQLLQVSNLYSEFMPNFKEEFSINKMTMSETSFECPNCKSMSRRYHIRNDYFTSYFCSDCGYFFSPKKDIKRIFHFFAPEYKDLKQETYAVELNNKIL